MTHRIILASGLTWTIFILGVSAHAADEPFIVNFMPRDLEIDYALSALPQHLRDDCTLYILNPEKGYEKIREGTNGFHAYVLRTAARRAFNRDWTYKYPIDHYAAMSWDQAGAESCMQVDFDLAELRAAGTPSTEAKRIINERYASGHYKAPARAGLSYMLAPIQRVLINAEISGLLGTLNLPHYMFYAPNVTDPDIGGQYGSNHPFMIYPGPHGFMIKLAGPDEKEAINQEHADLIQRLYEFNNKLVLPGITKR